ncbi:MAG: hypothetical protein KA028_00125 [Candidatus Pacebacteria bacterium]|nr:hypothetical protein [Candidatus Paceibacterota bacterium]MBP9851830.1 hypothetical protein [Candidatus Paceibacterota bacterium]
MKKNIVITIILMLVVGFVAGYVLKGSMKSAEQGAAVSLSSNAGNVAINQTFDSATNALAKVGATNVYRFDPSKITASVDLKTITKDTKRFTMRFPRTTIDGTTISPMLEPINCGMAPGFNSTVNCCNTESNNMTITNPRTGFTMTVTGGCVNGEWDRI